MVVAGTGSTSSLAVSMAQTVCHLHSILVGGGNQEIKIMEHTENSRIRKLTPLECWRLMGFDDEDFHKAEKVCSNSQLYKQAGNSIVVDVLVGILGNLLGEDDQ